jgi:hypothetical protein
MFKKIQHPLLLKYPLLWNLKIIPVLAITLLLNIIFFISGWIYGAIDFTDVTNDYNYGPPVVPIWLSIMLTILVFVIWLVFYLRNNAYNSYYPLKKASLYKQWLLLFIISLFNCAYIISFIYGKDCRERNYYPKEELVKRLDVLSRAAVFTDGGYTLSKDTVINEKEITRQYFTYSGKKYPFNSLINKSLDVYSLQDSIRNAKNEVAVKHWLIENKKDSVRKLMDQTLALVNEHKLKANITTDTWLGLTYNHPDYTNYIMVGNDDYNPIYKFEAKEVETEYAEDYAPIRYTDENIDPKANIKKIIKGEVKYFPKYYVPLLQLKIGYQTMSSAYTGPQVNPVSIAVLLYIAGALSLLILTFRISSPRNWLIAGLSVGITSIIVGLLTAVSKYLSRKYDIDIIDGEEFFFSVWILILFILSVYYFKKLQKKTSKGISGIIGNILIWLLPAIVPTIYALIMESLEGKLVVINGVEEYVHNPIRDLMDKYAFVMLYLNLVFVIIYMYFFTIAIKKWKGIAEA